MEGKKECRHTFKCTDSRKVDGYRRRRYRCMKCGFRESTIEVPAQEDIKKGEHTKMYRTDLMARLSNVQARSLLEQIDAGHKTLNLI